MNPNANPTGLFKRTTHGPCGRHRCNDLATHSATLAVPLLGAGPENFARVKIACNFCYACARSASSGEFLPKEGKRSNTRKAINNFAKRVNCKADFAGARIELAPLPPIL